MIRAIRISNSGNGELNHAQFKTLTPSVLSYIKHIGAIDFSPNVELVKAIDSIEVLRTFDGLLLIDDVEVTTSAQFKAVV